MTDHHPSTVRPVILCGGGGTRLWPLSRADLPKQFLPIIEDDSLLQATVRRCAGAPFLPPVIVAGEKQRFLVLDQIESAGVEAAAVILEPAPRNTAPAVALAALWSHACADDLILVMPSDHVVQDVPKLHAAVVAAMPAAAAGAIVTFGIRPSSPNPAYGYIRTRPGAEEEIVIEIDQFVEKPDRLTAASLLDDGNCYWNSGMFMMRPSVFLEELERLAPAIATATRRSMERPEVDGQFVRPAESAFIETPSDSIDYAVMERTARARVIPVDFGWSDVGSWDAVWDVLPHDAEGNVLRGDVVPIDVHNSLIRCETGMTIAAVGLSDMVCVITADAAFIAPRGQAQRNKEIVELLRANNHPRADAPPQVHRPWGTYQLIDEGNGFQARRLVVKPGAKQSLQVHRRRSEHWVIVSGTAEITVASEVRILQADESVLIPAGTQHRLANPGPDPLHVIEVRCGSYLGEDDVVRLDDVSERA